jgi:signal transduction histidine kinase
VGRAVVTLSNRTARVFLWLGILMTVISLVGSYLLHEYSGRKAAEAEVSYRLSLAGQLYDMGMSEDKIVELVSSPADESYTARGEEILAGYGYFSGMTVGGEYVIYSHLANDILSALLTAVCFFAGFCCIHTVFIDIRRLTAQLEHEEKIVFSDEHDIGLLGEAILSLRQKSEHLLKQLGDEKQYLADYLDDFSHQIKTPCTGLKLNNEILLSAPMPFEEQKDYLMRDKKCIDRISLLVSASLKLARLEAGAVEYHFEENDISEIAADAVAQLTAIAAENNAEMINEVKRGTRLYCDRLWLCEAVTNLIKNAAEHSNGGHVRIYSDCDPMTVRIFIEDNGCGISEEELPNVFRRFWSKSGAVNSNSVGIGMSVAKKIVEDMGGRLYIESELNKGTKIKLEFLRTVTLL